MCVTFSQCKLDQQKAGSPRFLWRSRGYLRAMRCQIIPVSAFWDRDPGRGPAYPLDYTTMSWLRFWRPYIHPYICLAARERERVRRGRCNDRKISIGKVCMFFMVVLLLCYGRKRIKKLSEFQPRVVYRIFTQNNGCASALTGDNIATFTRTVQSISHIFPLGVSFVIEFGDSGN